MISPTLQWWNSSLAAVSIVVIICAAVGNLYLIESHLDAYLLVLGISLLADFAWFLVFLVYGQNCKTVHSATDHLSSTVSCGVSSGLVLIGLCIIVVFKIYSIRAVSKAKRTVRIKYNEDLLPYLQKSLDSASPIPAYGSAQ